MINWKVRVKNKTFWITFIPAVLLLIQTVLALFGVTFDMSGVQGRLLAVVDAVFMVLGVLGVVVDHTTDGIGDSARAMTYTQPYMEEKKKR